MMIVKIQDLSQKAKIPLKGLIISLQYPQMFCLSLVLHFVHNSQYIPVHEMIQVLTAEPLQSGFSFL